MIILIKASKYEREIHDVWEGENHTLVLSLQPTSNTKFEHIRLTKQDAQKILDHLFPG